MDNNTPVPAPLNEILLAIRAAKDAGDQATVDALFSTLDVSTLDTTQMTWALRLKSGAPLMLCKKALAMFGGDYENALADLQSGRRSPTTLYD